MSCTANTAVVLVRTRVHCDRELADELLIASVDALVGSSARSVALTRRAGRRPRARVGARSIYLSLSHSSEFTAVAACFSPIGVDVERHRRVRAVRDVAGHLRGSLPLAWSGDDLSTIDRDVIAAWTRYESVVKAIGTGAALPPSEVSARCGERARFGELVLPLRTHTIALDDRESAIGCTLSVAARVGAPILIDHDGVTIRVPGDCPDQPEQPHHRSDARPAEERNQK